MCVERGESFLAGHFARHLLLTGAGPARGGALKGSIRDNGGFHKTGVPSGRTFRNRKYPDG